MPVWTFILPRVSVIRVVEAFEGISWRNMRKVARRARILHETNVHLRNKLAEPAEELARPGHFCDSSRTITMNHRTRSTVKSLELAGNEKSRLDRLAILSLLFLPLAQLLQRRTPTLCLRGSSTLGPQKFVWKVGTAKWCFVVAGKAEYFMAKGSFTLCPSTFQSTDPSSHTTPL